jgi:signal peptidase I
VEVRNGHLYVDRRRRSEASGDPLGRFGLETLGGSSYSVEVGPAGRIPEAGPLTVPESSVFVLGDARSLSRDSREFGVVALEKVRGRVLHIFWSLEPSRGRIRWERLGTRFASIFD